MKVIHVSNTIPAAVPGRSIFLAGPSPRETGQYNWRPKTLDILSEKGFDGSVFVPLKSDWGWLSSGNAQMDWELHCLDIATVILFWVPRDLKDLPGFTTNFEFGMFVKSGKVVLGYPSIASNMNYLRYLAGLNTVPVSHDLRQTVSSAIDLSKSL
jgi:nucleoside 2-deoxyribosyltransferase